MTKNILKNRSMFTRHFFLIFPDAHFLPLDPEEAFVAGLLVGGGNDALAQQALHGVGQGPGEASVLVCPECAALVACNHSNHSRFLDTCSQNQVFIFN